MRGSASRSRLDARARLMARRRLLAICYRRDHSPRTQPRISTKRLGRLSSRKPRSQHQNPPSPTTHTPNLSPPRYHGILQHRWQTWAWFSQHAFDDTPSFGALGNASTANSLSADAAPRARASLALAHAPLAPYVLRARACRRVTPTWCRKAANSLAIHRSLGTLGDAATADSPSSPLILIAAS